ncbi:MAG TPA: hypothetical protein VN048_09735 [Verrucomicrobiae bacterium]|nr:hypothetical protein [Verrucomicrobiae bacterium]
MINEKVKIGSGLGASGSGADEDGKREGPSGLATGTRADAEGGVGKKARRARSDTAVRRLTPEQQAKVDGWLFEERLSHAEVSERCLSELRIRLTKSGVGRYCRQEQGVRAKRKMSVGSGYVALLEGMNEAALKALERVEIGNDPKTLAEYARVLVAARQEANHALRATTTREKFEFDAATACLVHQVRVQSIVEDEALDDGQRILKIREELFGPDLPE